MKLSVTVLLIALVLSYGWTLTIDCFPVSLNDNSTSCLLGIPRSGSYSKAAEIVCDGNIVEVGHPYSYDDKYQLITSLNELLLKNELDAAHCESFEEIYAETVCFFNPKGVKIFPECSFSDNLGDKLSVF